MKQIIEYFIFEWYVMWLNEYSIFGWHHNKIEKIKSVGKSGYGSSSSWMCDMREIVMKEKTK